MQLLLALATGAAAPSSRRRERTTHKTVRNFNFGDFGKSKDYASAQEKIRSYDNTQTVETAKYGKRAIRATQLNGQNVLNPEPACAAFIAFAAFAIACALAGVPPCGAFTPCVVSGDGRGWFSLTLRAGAGVRDICPISTIRDWNPDLVTGGVFLFVCAVWLNWYGTFGDYHR